MTTPRQHRRRVSQVRITRDLVLFLIGVAGIVWSTVIEQVDRPYLLAIFAGCVGLPTYLATAAKRDVIKDDSKDDVV